MRRKIEGERHQLIKFEVCEERPVESWHSRNSRGVVVSEESWKRKRHKIGRVEESDEWRIGRFQEWYYWKSLKMSRVQESEESEIRRIGRDLLSGNRKSRMSTLIFYYYSDSVKYSNSLFLKYRHSFATIIPLNHSVRLATSQLY